MSIRKILSELYGLDGMEKYVDLFPYLDSDHGAYLGTDPQKAIEALQRAVEAGPSTPERAFEVYRERYELKAAREAGWEPQTNFEWAEVYRAASLATQEQLKVAGSIAVSCDREKVDGPDGHPWTKAFLDLQAEVELFSEYPSCQLNMIEVFQDRARAALGTHREKFIQYIQECEKLLQEKQSGLTGGGKESIKTFLTRATELVTQGDFIGAQKKIWQARAHLSGNVQELSETGFEFQRLPRSTRNYPEKETPRPFSELIIRARGRLEEKSLPWYLLNPAVLIEAKNPKSFLSQHASRNRDWYSYFKAFRGWLGLEHAHRKAKEILAEMAGLIGAGKYFWSGDRSKAKALFFMANPWKGAPYFEDRHGRSRVLAVMRLDEDDPSRIPRIKAAITQALGELAENLREISAPSSHERQLLQEGLVVVMLPGDFLTRMAEGYNRFYTNIDRGVWENRVAFIDDLDILRIHHHDSSTRLEAFLQMTLSRFKGAHTSTYRGSQAVNPFMFYGREAILEKVRQSATVIFSGRKMGKSSVLQNIFRNPGPDATAIWIGASGIPPWRSWMLLDKIGPQLAELVRKYNPAWNGDWQITTIGHVSGEDEKKTFARIMVEIKPRFDKFLGEAVEELRKRHISKLYVLVDEADGFIRAERIENAGRQVSATHAISWALKDLETIKHGGFLRFLFAGFDEVGQTENTYSAPANWGGIEVLSPLEEREALRLIREPMSSLGVLIDEHIAHRILDYTSGHASLIQLFCNRLLERVQAVHEAKWPLEDINIEVEDIDRVMDGEGYQRDMYSTLELNLKIGRLFPLRVLFYGIVSPVGLQQGQGRLLSLENFTYKDVVDQVRHEQVPEGLRDPSMIEKSLNLLCELGLLSKDPHAGFYSVRARHYANYLRTRNNFQAHVQQAIGDFRRQVLEPVPRQVWDLPDQTLAILNGLRHRTYLVAGLPNSGQAYLADVLTSPLIVHSGRQRHMVRAGEAGWQERIEALRKDSAKCEMVVVLEDHHSIPWSQIREILTRFQESDSPVLRWIGGAGTSFEIARDTDTYLSVETAGLAGITTSELDQWAAMTLGWNDDSPTHASIVFSEENKDKIIEAVGSLIPMMALWRDYLQKDLPEPVELEHAEKFCRQLKTSTSMARDLSGKLARGIPGGMRRGFWILYRLCERLDMDDYVFKDSDLFSLNSRMVELEGVEEHDKEFWAKEDEWQSLVEAAKLLGLIWKDRKSSVPLYRVPYRSALGILIRDPQFASA